MDCFGAAKLGGYHSAERSAINVLMTIVWPIDLDMIVDVPNMI